MATPGAVDGLFGEFGEFEEELKSLFKELRFVCWFGSSFNSNPSILVPLEDSVHNPRRYSKVEEKEPLLSEKGDGYWPRSSDRGLNVTRASVTKVTNAVRVGFGSGWAVEDEEGEKEREVKVEGEIKMARLWVEGWRARLRGGGDLVEKCRDGFEG